MLVAAVLLCMFAFSVNAEAETVATEGYYTYEVINDYDDYYYVAITDVDESISGSVTVPETLGGYPVNNIGNDAFADCTNMTSVVLPDAVDIINGDAFENCSSLKSIVMNEVYWIGTDAFSGCTALTDVWCGGYKESIDIMYGNEALESATWHEGACMKDPDFGSHSFENACCVYCQKKEILVTDIAFAENDIYLIENADGIFNEDLGYFVYEIFQYNIPVGSATLNNGDTVSFYHS